MSTNPAQKGATHWLRAMSVQADVVGALIMRELHTRYGRENIGYLWLLLEPMFLATAVAIIHFAQPSHSGSDINAVAFSTVGYCIFILFRGIFNRAEGAIESNQPLLYHRMVTVFDILLSRALLEAAGCFGTFLVLLYIGMIIGLADLPARPEYLIGGFAYMAWFSFNASMLVCAATHENRLIARFVHPVSYILMPVSGAFYQLEWIPEPYRGYLLWFPMPHIFEIARHGQFRSAPDDYFSQPYLIGSCMVMMLFGLLALKVVRRHIHLR